MPRGDRTGPAGQGPMTGRGLGYCSGSNNPGFMSPGFGRGMAQGRGGGYGRGFRWRAPVITQQVQPRLVPAQPSASDEKQMLQQSKEEIKQEVKGLKDELDQIEKRLKELK